MPESDHQTQDEPKDGPSPGTEPPLAFVIVTTTTDSEGSAKLIGETLVRERLASCVHFSRTNTVYRWEGDVRVAEEHVVEAMTRRDLFDRVVAQIHELHPYDLPQVVSTPILDGNEAYLRWIDDSVARA